MVNCEYDLVKYDSKILIKNTWKISIVRDEDDP